MLGKKLEIEVKMKLSNEAWAAMNVAWSAAYFDIPESERVGHLYELKRTIHLYHHKSDGSSERVTFVNSIGVPELLSRTYFLKNTKVLDPSTGFYDEEESVTTPEHFLELLNSNENISIISKMRQVLKVDDLEYEIDYFDVPRLPYEILEIEFNDMDAYVAYMAKLKEEGRLPMRVGGAAIGSFPLVEDVTFDPAYRNIVLSVPKKEVDIDAIIRRRVQQYLPKCYGSEVSSDEVEE